MSAFELSVRTDVGRARQRNEDSALSLEWRMEGQQSGTPVVLIAVADGMGGHSNGQVASKMALRALAGALAQGLANAPLEGLESLPDDQIVDILAVAVEGASQRVNLACEQGLSDMGTTLCAALLVGRRGFIANVGDSRCYLIENGIQQITTDHSVVAQLVARGELTAEEARTHPRRNEIYRMIGFGRRVQPDFFTLELRPNDVLLLCSDGLSGLVRDEEIYSTVTHADLPLSAATQQLIDLANSRGGEDNITIVAVRAPSQTEGR